MKNYKNLTFCQLLDIPEFKKLIEQIEELTHETEPRLISIKKMIISDLKKQFQFVY